jgi:hypothetical protein
VTNAGANNIRFASLAQVLDALHANDAAALTRPASLRRYVSAFLVDAHRRLVQLDVRARGNVDRGPAEWVELVDYRIGYRRTTIPKRGLVYVPRLESRQTFENVRNRAAPVMRPDAIKPHFCRIVYNVLIEVRPLLPDLQAAVLVTTGVVGAMVAVEAPDTAAFAGEAKARTSKFKLVWKCLVDLHQQGRLVPDLQPAEVEEMVHPLFRKHWKKIRPRQLEVPSISRTMINRVYQEFLTTYFAK